MLAFSRAILLMCVWTRDMMGYADALKKIMKFVVLTPNQFAWLAPYDQKVSQHGLGNHVIFGTPQTYVAINKSR
jgi:hypothetical protein